MKRFCVFFFLLLFSVNLFADDDDDKQKLAVMEFEDRSGNLSAKTLSDATEYIRGAFVSSNKFIVIAKERQEKALIKEMKKESYKSCNDKNCQIPLGQALSADTILRTTINFFGGVYTITSELIDLAKEATVSGAKQNFDGSEKSLMQALDRIVVQITGTGVSYDISAMQTQEIQGVKLGGVELDTMPKVEMKEADFGKTPKKTTSNKISNVNSNKNQASKTETKPETQKKEMYHPYKTAGISLIVVGAVITVAGVAGFHVASDKEYDKYKKFTEYSTATNYVGSWSKEKYVSEANKHRNKSNTYRILEITSGIIGGAAFVTGIALTAVKKEKPKNFALTNLSVAPANDGFYASLGFEF